MRKRPDLFFAGQITGVEGYMESAGSGVLAGLNAARRLRGQDPLVLPRETMLGALAGYISDPSVKNFQPMGANFGVLPPLERRFVRKGRDMNRFLPGHWKLFPPGCGRKASINKTA